jgi:hypothetical protein
MPWEPVLETIADATDAAILNGYPIEPKPY